MKKSELIISIEKIIKPFNKKILEFLFEKNRITKETNFLISKDNESISLKIFRIINTENEMFFYSKNEKDELIVFNPQNIYKIDGCSVDQILEIFSLNEDGTIRKDIKRKRGKKPELKNIIKRNVV